MEDGQSIAQHEERCAENPLYTLAERKPRKRKAAKIAKDTSNQENDAPREVPERNEPTKISRKPLSCGNQTNVDVEAPRDALGAHHCDTRPLASIADLLLFAAEESDIDDSLSDAGITTNASEIASSPCHLPWLLSVPDDSKTSKVSLPSCSSFDQIELQAKMKRIVFSASLCSALAFAHEDSIE